MGVADLKPQRLQGVVTQTLWVALADFPKLDDLSRERLTKWGAVMPERRKRHLEGKAHETDSFVVELLAV